MPLANRRQAGVDIDSCPCQVHVMASVSEVGDIASAAASDNTYVVIELDLPKAGKWPRFEAAHEKWRR
ncbi:hypothetical protein LSAT2_017414 [Lamellibrachia satsuma]|nr:hypothetical protein LSAT2_017414 [Lamellibrachia satsuma]